MSSVRLSWSFLHRPRHTEPADPLSSLSVHLKVRQQRLSTELANASFRSESQNVALLAAGGARDELQVSRVILRIQPNPQQPHGATADFDLVRMEMAREVSRERWTLSLQFLFLEEIPPDLIVSNPMGIIINYLQGDRATVTGDQ